jgi:hypothetical protein
MVQRHEGVYDGRYKLIHFYDLNEWELIDMETDPHELTNQFHSPKYTSVKNRMRLALTQMKEHYDVPEGIPAPRVDVNPMRYYSTQRKVIEQRGR